MTIETRAFARAGLLGNPSDGYFGKIIAVTLSDFSARVRLEESDRIRLIPSPSDECVFEDPAALYESVSRFGYYGGLRLLKAAVKRFLDFCRARSLSLPPRNFSLSYETDIPRQLGLGGSSAIIVAAFRALMTFYGVEIPSELLPTLVLEAERDELGINAGYMDRVIQVYEGCVYMDLDRSLIAERGYGRYERLHPKMLPPLYMAYKPVLGKVSGRVLNPIRESYEKGEPIVHEALARLAELAERGREALLAGRVDVWPDLMNENFDLRARIMPISDSNLELIRTARDCGASAKFAGSGGSIIGTYRGDEMFLRLKERLAAAGALVLKPRIS